MVNKMKRVLIIFVLIFGILLNGCSIDFSNENNQEEITDNGHEDGQEEITDSGNNEGWENIIDDIDISGDVAPRFKADWVVVKNFVIYNEERLHEFYQKTNNKEEDSIRILKVVDSNFLQITDDDAQAGYKNIINLKYDGEKYILEWELNTQSTDTRLVSCDYLKYSYTPYTGMVSYLFTNDPVMTSEDYIRQLSSSSLVMDFDFSNTFLLDGFKLNELVFSGCRLNEAKPITYYDGNTTKYYYSHYTSSWMITEALQNLHYQQNPIQISENERYISFDRNQKLICDRYKLIDKNDKWPLLDVHYDIYLNRKIVKLSLVYCDEYIELYAQLTDEQIALLTKIISNEREICITEGAYRHQITSSDLFGYVFLELFDDNKACISYINNSLEINLVEGSYIVDDKKLIISSGEAQYVFNLAGYASKQLFFDQATSINISEEFKKYISNDDNFYMDLAMSNNELFKNLDTSLGLDIFVFSRTKNRCILVSHKTREEMSWNDILYMYRASSITLEAMKDVLSTYNDYELNFINIYYLCEDLSDNEIEAKEKIAKTLGLNILTSVSLQISLDQAYPLDTIYASVGDSMDISFNLNPTDYKYKNVYYKSSDASVVSIDANGKANFVGEGNAYIIISVDGILAYYPVNVGRYKNVLEMVIASIDKITLYDLNSSDYYTYTNNFLINTIKNELLNLEFVKADYQLSGKMIAQCQVNDSYVLKVYISDVEVGEIYVDWLKIDSPDEMQFVGRYVALQSGGQVLKYFQIDINEIFEDPVVFRYLDCVLTNEEQEKIVKNFIVQRGDLGSAIKDGYKLNGWLRGYYGKYNGYYAVMVDGAGLMYDTALWTIIIDGVKINYFDGNRICLISDDNVISLQEGLSRGIINHDDLETISTIKNQN